MTTSEVCAWLKRAWKAVNEKTIIKLFNKCRTSDVMHTTEDTAVLERGNNNNMNGDINEAMYSTRIRNFSSCPSEISRSSAISSYDYITSFSDEYNTLPSLNFHFG
ncbi:hypothetical protein Trydic_g1496 [Trypoxylus dichotomus]